MLARRERPDEGLEVPVRVPEEETALTSSALSPFRLEAARSHPSALPELELLGAVQEKLSHFEALTKTTWELARRNRGEGRS